MLERSNGHRINQVDTLAGNGRLCFSNWEKIKQQEKLSWHVSRASGWRRAWSKNLMGIGAQANPCQHRALSPGAITPCRVGNSIYHLRQGCNNWVFCSNFPPQVPSGPSCSASSENPEQESTRTGRTCSGCCTQRWEQTLAPRSHFSCVPLRDRTPLFLEFLQSSHILRRPAGPSSAHV